MLKNESYTIFVCKDNNLSNEQLLIETKDYERAKAAIKWANDNGYHITRQYDPNTLLDIPNFKNTITI